MLLRKFLRFVTWLPCVSIVPESLRLHLLSNCVIIWHPLELESLPSEVCALCVLCLPYNYNQSGVSFSSHYITTLSSHLISSILFLSIRNGFSTRYDLTPVELPFSEKSHEFKPQMKTDLLLSCDVTSADLCFSLSFFLSLLLIFWIWSFIYLSFIYKYIY